MIPGTVVVKIGEINAGDGLGYGHGLVARDVLESGHIDSWYWEEVFGINDGAVGGVWVCGDVEGRCGSNSEREVSLAVSADGNRCTRERNWWEYDGSLCNSWRCG